MKPIFRELGTYLKDKRSASGVSQIDVAKKLGYTSPQFVSNVERGLCSYPLNKLKKLNKIIGADLNVISDMMIKSKITEIHKGLGIK